MSKDWTDMQSHAYIYKDNKFYHLRWHWIATLLALALSCTNASANATQQDELKQVLNNLSLPMIEEVSKIYESRKYGLIWSNGNKYNDKAYDLYRVIQNIQKLGLNPKDYDLDIIKYFLETTIHDTKILTKSDITFTHAYVRLAAHIDHKYYAHKNDLILNYGFLDSNTFLSRLISEDLQIKSTQQSQELGLQNTDPYSRLLNALEKYRALKNNFEPIFLQQKSFTIGDASPEITKVRQRLFELGDYRNSDLNNQYFDETLALAISDFQYRHGLKSDGILGKRTAREINRSIESRLVQMELNLERARKLSELQDKRYILVNVPEYKLYVIENGVSVYQTRIIVGKKRKRTPVISSEISEFVLNPYWNVPASITKEEIIPKLYENPNYLVENGMKVISRLHSQNVFLDPRDVNWHNIDIDNSSIRIRQDPGARNALGRVKFVFPNNYKVYLHDTPRRNLFAYHSRAFSHGCVRVENPLELAEVLLRDSPSWTTQDLDYFINRNKTKVIKLNRPIPIHIVYMTAWVDAQGVIHFRPDIYKRDSQIANNLYNAAQ